MKHKSEHEFCIILHNVLLLDACAKSGSKRATTID